MKLNKQIAAILLSITLLTSTAFPSLAEPETGNTVSTPETSQTSTPQQDSDDAAQTEGQEPDTSQSDNQTDASDGEEQAQDDPSSPADGEQQIQDDPSNPADGEQQIQDDPSSPADGEQQPAESAEDEPQNQTSSIDADGNVQMPTITLDCKASILVNAETGEIIHANNETEKMYPASCTKIMTALLTLENSSLDDVVTMDESDFIVNSGASTSGLRPGEQITIENLLYCLLLPSGNEAANALARTVGGSVEEFASMMNARAKELGCVNTHFANPHGLHDQNHYTCAYDLYLIARQAMQNETFAAIVNTAQKRLPATNKNEERVIYTTNALILSTYSSIYYDNCYGIKTGHTTPAGYCFVSYAKKDNYTYYSVVLGADAGEEYAGSFTETKRMFEWAFDNFDMINAIESGEAVTECPVRLGKGTDHVTVVTQQDIPVLVPKGLEANQLDVDISVDDSYDAPIAKGQKLGTVTYSYNGMECATADLVALAEVERSTILYVFDQIAQFLRQTPVRIVIGIIIVVLILYIIFSFIAGRNRRKRNRLKRERKQKFRRK